MIHSTNGNKIDELIESITLNVFNAGTKEINYQIIKSLPTDVESIMKKTKLTKVPINQRLNELEKYGLLRREKGTGRVYPTEFTEDFKLLISKVKKQVKDNLTNILPMIINN